MRPSLPQTLAPGSKLAQQVAHLKLSELRSLGYIQQCVIAVQIGLAQKVPGSFAAPENVVGQAPDFLTPAIDQSVPWPPTPLPAVRARQGVPERRRNTRAWSPLAHIQPGYLDTPISSRNRVMRFS